MKNKILIIEDDDILQKALKQALKESGFAVAQAYDGTDGLKQAIKDRPDLILLDLKLPKKDGYHVLSEILGDKKLKKIPVLILTALASESSTAECLALGARDYILKSDFSLDKIIKKINKYIS